MSKSQQCTKSVHLADFSNLFRIKPIRKNLTATKNYIVVCKSLLFISKQNSWGCKDNGISVRQFLPNIQNELNFEIFSETTYSQLF